MNFDKLFTEYPYIESEALILRKIEHDDINDFFELCSDEALFKYKPGKAKTNKEAVDNMINHYERDFNKKKTIFLGIYLKNENSKLIGLGEIFDFDHKTNVVTFGYTINRHYWGRGFATKYTKMVLDFLINEVEINRVQAFVMPENVSSQKVLEKCGFVKEGIIRQGHFWKDKGIVDLIMYSILKKEYVNT
ncbi:GNAT family N-acetyltransferase [Fusibacter bizertensis]